MRITESQLRRIVRRMVNEQAMDAGMQPGADAMATQTPDVEGLNMAMSDVYGRPRAFKPMPGDPNTVLVKDTERPGQFWPWVYEASGPYAGWNEGDGPVDAMGNEV